MKHKIYPIGKIILLLAVICLQLTSCRNITGKDSILYLQLKQALQQAKASRSNGDAESAARTLEALFCQLPAQSTDNDSIRLLAQEAVSEYCSAILTTRNVALGLHFFDSLNAVIPPLFLLNECRYDICAISTHWSMMLRDNRRSEALLDSFLRMPDPPEAWRLIKYNEMAATVTTALRGSKESIRLLEKAVDTYRAGGTFKSMGRVLAWLGYTYRDNSRYEDAMRMNEEAIEYYQTHDEDYSTVVAYGEQSNVYHLLEMHDKALDMNSKAIAAARRNSGYNLGDALRYRGKILYDLHQPDSAIYYYRKGREASTEVKSLSGIIASDMWLANIYSQIPDSVHKAVTLLETLLPDSAQIPPFIKEEIKAIMGKALLASGKTTDAITLLESATSGFTQLGDNERETEAYTTLMKAYRTAGLTERFMAHYPYYTQLQDTLQRKKNIRSIAIASVRFDAKQKEQQNQLLTAEVALKNSRMQTLVILGCALLLLLSAGFLIRQRTLKHRLRLRAQEQEFSEKQLQEQAERLRQLIASRQELNTHNEDLLRQLAEVQSTRDKSCDLDIVLEKLQPRLLTREEEEQFRRAFASLYPSVLHRLRSVCANATRSEELLCMLIVLKQTNEEISRTLGVSRSTVLKNRYRLRVKLGLPEGADIDAEVQAMLLPS